MTPSQQSESDYRDATESLPTDFGAEQQDTDLDDTARIQTMETKLNNWVEELKTSQLSPKNPFVGLDKSLHSSAAELLSQALNHLANTNTVSLEEAMTEFNNAQGPIRGELADTLLLAADEWGVIKLQPSTSNSELADALASMPPQEPLPAEKQATAPTTTSPETLAEGKSYTVQSGDTMYAILTNQLSADSALKSKVAQVYKLSSDLAPGDLVRELFKATKDKPFNQKLEQNLIYPGDVVLFAPEGGISYLSKPLNKPASSPMASEASPEPVAAGAAADLDPATDGLALAEDENATNADAEPTEPSEGDRSDSNPTEESPAAPPAAESAPEAEPAPTPEVSPEARFPQNLEDLMTQFPGLRIDPKDLKETVYPDPADPSKSIARAELRRFAFHGEVKTITLGESVGVSDSQSDVATAKREALQRLSMIFSSIIPPLEKSYLKDVRQPALNGLPADFIELRNLFKQNRDINHIQVIIDSHNPDEQSDTYHCNIKVLFEVDGTPSQVDLHYPDNHDVEGPNLTEAKQNAYKAVMKIFNDPKTLAMVRQAATQRADQLLADRGKTELLPLSAAEHFAYFRQSIERRADGSVAFKIFHPLAESNSGEPCQGLLSPNGTLRLITPNGVDVSFKMSHTSRFNGQDKDQPFRGVRLVETASAAVAKPRGYAEILKNPGNPWLDRVTDRAGIVTDVDMVIGDGLLYNIARGALLHKAPQPDNTQQPDPETFLEKYRISNNFHNVAGITPRDELLPTEYNYLWVKPIEKKL